MVLAPREIRRKRFTLVRRGFDPEEVGRFLAELADQIETLTAAARQHRYRKLGREVEAVLRTAHDEAGRMRGEAKRAAQSIRDDAALYALELKRETDQDRDEAKRLLVRSQERAASLVREAEEQAAGIVKTAEALARSRTTQILAQAQRRVDRLTRDEQQAQSRLLNAQADLQAVIDRVGRSTGGGVIDLTAEPPVATPPLESEGSDDPDLEVGGENDPVAEMVRDAVGKAVEHSARDASADTVNDGEPSTP